MKRRSYILIALAAAFMMPPAASDLHASETTDPTSTQESRDTVLSVATKGLIESFGELSKTAGKLSETALKLLEAQKLLDERETTDSPAVKNQTVTKRRKTNTTAKTATTQERNTYQQTAAEEREYEEIPNFTDFTEPESTAGTVYIEEEPEEYSGPRVFISEETEYTEPEQEDTEPTGTLKSIWDLQPEDGEGGHYVWVPDGTPGPSVIKTYDSEPNLNEKVYWRGDSIPMALGTKRYGRYDRKLYNWLIYPKGQWHISLSANYGELSTDDSELLSLMKDIDISGKIYSIKPSVSYFFKHNLNAGIRLAFTKGELGIGSFKVDIDEDMNFDLHDIKYQSESYSAAIFLQQHFGLSRRGRFSVYNEVEIAAGTGNKHFIRPFDGNIRDTRTKTQSFNINYSPGVSIMMMKNAAFNLSFGIFGFHLQNEKQWENGEESGNRFTSGINFRFNIFNINFGVSVII